MFRVWGLWKDLKWNDNFLSFRICDFLNDFGAERKGTFLGKFFLSTFSTVIHNKPLFCYANLNMLIVICTNDITQRLTDCQLTRQGPHE